MSVRFNHSVKLEKDEVLSFHAPSNPAFVSWIDEDKGIVCFQSDDREILVPLSNVNFVEMALA